MVFGVAQYPEFRTAVPDIPGSPAFSRQAPLDLIMTFTVVIVRVTVALLIAQGCRSESQRVAIFDVETSCMQSSV